MQSYNINIANINIYINIIIDYNIITINIIHNINIANINNINDYNIITINIIEPEGSEAAHFELSSFAPLSTGFYVVL